MTKINKQSINTGTGALITIALGILMYAGFAPMETFEEKLYGCWFKVRF